MIAMKNHPKIHHVLYNKGVKIHYKVLKMYRRIEKALIVFDNHVTISKKAMTS